MAKSRLKTAGQAALLLLGFLISITHGAELTPPYFNLALNKKVTASATCGEYERELYCKLVGANTELDEKSIQIQLLQGQYCDYCDSNDPEKMHPPEYAVDALDTWWQSPPLSRNIKYNEVNFTIALGQEFHVAYVFVRMGNSPRPGLWILEKSSDYGETYTPWQYFSDSPEECERLFGRESLKPISRDDSVICSTQYSQIVPLEGGEIPISLLTSRPSANHYFNSSTLQEWTRATHVRLRLLRTKNMMGHLMSIGPSDTTVTRRFYYSIKDISIGGRCMCNGHADTCDPVDENSHVLQCVCQHNTYGPKCNQCRPGYQQKPWRINQEWNKFECEKCNCHNHSNDCIYDPDVDAKRLSIDMHGHYEGGGVCQNCQHNTKGINCNQCQEKFYRPWVKSWGDIDVCNPCNCDPHFSTGNCLEGSGQCECRIEFNPPNCDSCRIGYFDYPDCKRCPCNINGTSSLQCQPDDGKCSCKYNFAGEFCEVCADGYYSEECKVCDCNVVGSVSSVCDKVSGNCTCKNKYAGQQCDQCQPGFYNYPTCQLCDCDQSGTEERICDLASGVCLCKEGFGGPRCDQCIPGFFMEVRGREKVCTPCNCSALGSTSNVCSLLGKCSCLSNYGGQHCDQCSPGHYKYPECLQCNCDVDGSIGVSCDDNGQCQCKPNFDKLKCDTCKEYFYNYPACEACNCNPIGVISSFQGCGSVPAGELCQCKDRVQGRICDDCRSLYWDLQDYNPHGCKECNCNLSGTQGGIGVCDTKTGQCPCKLAVGSQSCGECQDGYYSLVEKNVFGCTDCDCDVGGAIDSICDKQTGQCKCHPRVEGRRCDQPIKLHYFPTLHEMQYELEEGRTPSNEPVRYGFDENIFPGYSWKSYAEFSRNQKEVLYDVSITKTSIYPMVLRFVNNNANPATVSITATPEQQNVYDTGEQTHDAVLKPSEKPQFVHVKSSFVLIPGVWEFKFKTDHNVLIDYFVLIPTHYVEASTLTKQIKKPCTVGEQDLCRHFAYPALPYPTAFSRDISDSSPPYLENNEQLNTLALSPKDLPILDGVRDELTLKLQVPRAPEDYVLVVQYATPVNASEAVGGFITVRLKSPKFEDFGLVVLEACPYTSLCRQVLVTPLSQEQVFHIEDTDNTLTLTAEPETLAAIHSVVAIPEREWNLDYISPKQVCIMSNKFCKPASFITHSDSKKFELEPLLGAEKMPSAIGNTTAVLLKPSIGEAQVLGKVPKPGLYHFVVHYYQPDSPTFKINAIVQPDAQAQGIPAILKVDHCPSKSGCRGNVLQADGNMLFMINDNFTVFFKETAGKGVWLTTVLLIDSEDYQPAVLDEMNSLDQTKDFLENCAQNFYYVNTDAEGFCRDAIFSIVTSYNGGALECHCNTDGSLSLQCDQFGGQCQCRPNVIGRSCSTCRSGYYGFPNCRPCHCPSGCDDDGVCRCPRNVQGEMCDRCKPHTYSFNLYAGCLECNCNPLGVKERNLQCDLDSGDCDCKENVVGRMCDKCVAGNYAFPYCIECQCNRKGTTDEICDQNNAACLCKENVFGAGCEECANGYFNLEADNPKGCTKCFCFGKTTKCSSALLYWAQIIGLEDWYLVNINIDKEVTEKKHDYVLDVQSEGFVGAELNSEQCRNKIVYFAAPNHYLGSKLSSYGGLLNYTILFVMGESGNAINYPDIILKGNTGYLLHYSIEQPPSATYWTHSVQLTEMAFETVDRKPASREQLLTILQALEGIYIRATYWENGATTRLRDVSLEVGQEAKWEESAVEVTSVEQCQCPKGYKGLSCEQCAEGFYRVNNGPHGGYCQPCECNGHAETCDVNTGECINCVDNTMGLHCEFCIRGYYGDATRGTPYDCMICACPLPIASNNFADSCEVSENGRRISCQCQEGYQAPMCDYCAPGFYGRPAVEGDYCKPCNCSGNIDASDPASCDTVSGQCLKCMHNTGGVACNLCAAGFYGDAILLKNCQTCDCYEPGTRNCDSYTGRCECHEGVMGDRCDRCEPEKWGIDSGQGCRSCECGEASVSAQCDIETGQCPCASGVTGRQCDQCARGFWNYTKQGCAHCNCNKGYSAGLFCNTQTGQCECLPNAIGDKCDMCPYRWVLIPNERCEECDSCTHGLLDTVEDLRHNMGPIASDFKTKANSFFTTQRLNYLANKLVQLTPKVQQLDPGRYDIARLTETVENLELEARNLDRRAAFVANDSRNAELAAQNLHNNVTTVYDEMRKAINISNNVIAQVEQLATSVKSPETPEVDPVAEAAEIVEFLKGASLKPKLEAVEAQQEKAAALENLMKQKIQPAIDQSKQAEDLHKGIKNFEYLLKDLDSHSDQAQETIRKTENLNAKNQASTVGANLESVVKLNDEANANLKSAAARTNNATMAFLLAKTMVDQVKNETEGLLDLQARTKEVLEDFDDRKVQLADLREQSQAHTYKIINKADQLNHLLEELQNNKEINSAYNAASAYKSIVDDMVAAKNVSTDAMTNATALKQLVDNVNERSEPSLKRSEQTSNDAVNLGVKARDEIEPVLNELEALTNDTKIVVDDTTQIVDNIESSLSSIPDILPSASASNLDAVSFQIASVKENMEEFQDIQKHVDRASELYKTTNEVVRNISLLGSQIQNINNNAPEIESLVKKIQTQQAEVDALKKRSNAAMEALQELVKRAKGVASRVNIAVKFDKNSTLQPELPVDLDEMQLSTHVSAYFRTQKENGFLLYLGNQDGNRMKRSASDDYMAIEIMNGFPALAINVGGQMKKLYNNKHVSDNNWYQVIVDRVGKQVNFTIKGEKNGEPDISVASAELSGHKTIFNLDKDSSKLFVGGYQTKLPNVTYYSFEGTVDDVVIGNTPVSLWNFVKAENLKGAEKPYDPARTCRFHGDGYVAVPIRDNDRPSRNLITFTFKTYSPEGLMYLQAKDKAFIAIAIREGIVILQYRLDDKIVTVEAKKLVNDGRTHMVKVQRDGRNANLTVDETLNVRGDSDGEETMFPEYDKVYFGGCPSSLTIEGIVNKPFDGCIDSVTVAAKRIDLAKQAEAVGITSACQFQNVVTLEGTNSFLAYNDISLDDFDLNIKFKTSKPNAVIFSTSNLNVTSDNRASISLALLDGKLDLVSVGEALDSGSHTFNDNKWHAVNVIHNSGRLQFTVDDYYVFTSKDPPKPLSIAKGKLFLGGIPQTYLVITARTRESIDGCLQDAILNGQIVPFNNPHYAKGVSYGRCEIGMAHTIGSYSGTDEAVFSNRMTEPPRVATTVKPTEPTSSPPPERKTEQKSDKAEKESIAKSAKQTPPTTKRPAPKTKTGCAPQHNNNFFSLANTKAYRFGTRNDSRIEFKSLPGPHRDGFDISVNFKSRDRDGGLIFYAADTLYNQNLIALYLKDGKVHFHVNCGRSSLVTSSPERYNDNGWHQVLVSKSMGSIKMVIDESVVVENPMKCVAAQSALQPPFSFGGLSNAAVDDAKKNLGDFYSPFMGCLSDLKMLGKSFPEASTTLHVLPCRDDDTSENSVYFGPGGGHLKLIEHYKVGMEMSISVDIKPFAMSGLLVGVVGKKDFMMLELVNGEVVLRVNNGKGPFEARYTFNGTDSLCDGNWHTIQAVKSRHVATVAVDNHFSKAGIGMSPSTDTRSALFIGGGLIHHNSSLSKQAFHGCIKNIAIKQVSISISSNGAVGDTSVGVCPSD